MNTKGSKRLFVPLGLAVAGLALIMAKGAADASALAAAGFLKHSGLSPQAYFSSCIRAGVKPRDVARCTPPGASIDRFVSPISGSGDSVLLERYTYHAWSVGRWPVQIYYIRGGGVDDYYAQDSWPSLSGARPVTAAEAERWLNGAAAEVENRKPAT